jgi:hypothetical protein
MVVNKYINYMVSLHVKLNLCVLLLCHQAPVPRMLFQLDMYSLLTPALVC